MVSEDLNDWSHDKLYRISEKEEEEEDDRNKSARQK